MKLGLKFQLQLYTAKSQYWLHKAGASPEHWQFKINNLLMKVLWKHKITQLKHQLKQTNKHSNRIVASDAYICTSLRVEHGYE